MKPKKKLRTSFKNVNVLIKKFAIVKILVRTLFENHGRKIDIEITLCLFYTTNLSYEHVTPISSSPFQHFRIFTFFLLFFFVVVLQTFLSPSRHNIMYNAIIQF